MANTMAGWTRALLGRHTLLASEDVDEVRTRIAKLLNDHVLQPRGPTLAARLHGVQANDLSLWMLEYGDAVQVEETRPGGHFLLVQLPLSGSVDVECEEGSWVVEPGMGLILPSNVPHRLNWRAGASQIILKVPLHRAGLEYAELTGASPTDPLQFRRAITLQSTDGAQWSALMRYFCEQVAQPSPMGALKVKLAEQALIRHLLCAQSVTLQERYLGHDADQIPQRLRRAREFIEANLQSDMTLADIAEHSGTSVRSLSRMFQLQYGVSPIQRLRELRLDKIRLELGNPGIDTNVSEIAMNWGYTHLGRFAAAYRQRFGEAPSQTLEAARARYRQARDQAGQPRLKS